MTFVIAEHDESNFENDAIILGSRFENVKNQKIFHFNSSECECEGLYFKAFCPFLVCILKYARVYVISIQVGVHGFFLI